MHLGSLVCDLIARINNGGLAKKTSIDVVKSNLVLNILSVLKEEGYIGGYFITPKMVTVYLKYDTKNQHIIRKIKAKSKPSLRKYIGKEGILSSELFGIHILSTNKGIMTNVKAQQLGIGGELLMEVC